MMIAWFILIIIMIIFWSSLKELPNQLRKILLHTTGQVSELCKGERKKSRRGGGRGKKGGREAGEGRGGRGGG